MKKVLIFLCFFAVSFSASAQTRFEKLQIDPPNFWEVEKTAVTYSNPKTKFMYRFTQWVRFKASDTYFYKTLTIDCVNHTMSITHQDGSILINEYINPGHPAWSQRNKFCN
jgi:hypothetical protein